MRQQNSATDTELLRMRHKYHPHQADAPAEFCRRYRTIAHAPQIPPPTRQMRQQNSSTDTELLRMRHKYHPHQADAPAEFFHRYRTIAHASQIPPPPGRRASRILPQIQSYCACVTNPTPTRQMRQQNSATDTELMRMFQKMLS